MASELFASHMFLGAFDPHKVGLGLLSMEQKKFPPLFGVISPERDADVLLNAHALEKLSIPKTLTLRDFNYTINSS